MHANVVQLRAGVLFRKAQICGRVTQSEIVVVSVSYGAQFVCIHFVLLDRKSVV